MKPRQEKTAPPAWRKHATLGEGFTFVACRCGVDMEFCWPPGQDEVRCFGCGARFSRPEHIPATSPASWRPHAFTRWARLRRFARAHRGVLALTLLAACVLAAGLAVWLGQPR